MVKWLVNECKVSPKVKTYHGIQPLHLPALNGHLDVMKWLVEECKVSPKVKNNDDLQPLHGASQGGWLEVVKWLVKECEVSPEVKSIDGTQPLHSAAQKGHLEVVKWLVIECGVDTKAKGAGKDALSFAKKEGKSQVVEYLSLIDNILQNKTLRDQYVCQAAKRGDLSSIQWLVGNRIFDQRVKDGQGVFGILKSRADAV